MRTSQEPMRRFAMGIAFSMAGVCDGLSLLFSKVVIFAA
jgi:hypothetical protein